MDIGFFINYDDQIVQLPVNPEKVTVSFSGNNKTSEIIGLGEITLLRNRKLAEITFESFFPQEDWFPGVRTRGKFKTPSFYKDFIESIFKDQKVCRLVITGIGVTMQCSIENFEYYHQGGDHEDAYYSITLKEYREYHITQIPVDNSLKRLVSSNKNNTVSPAPAKPVSPTQITKGCTVVLNGRVHYDSYGSKPGKTFTNYKGVVKFVNMKGSHPYCIYTTSGGALGWVTKESVVLA